MNLCRIASKTWARILIPAIGVSIAGTAWAATSRLSVRTSSHDAGLFVENTNPNWSYGGHFVDSNGVGVAANGSFAGFEAWGGWLGAWLSGTAYGVYAQAPTAGFFDGDVVVTGNLDVVSDAKVKENIRDIPSSEAFVDKLLQLKPKTFEYKDKVPGVHTELPQGTQVGFIAQEVQKTFPHLVKEVTVPAKAGQPKTTLLSVNYVEIIPMLVAALQEQQAKIEDLEKDVKP